MIFWPTARKHNGGGPSPRSVPTVPKIHAAIRNVATNGHTKSTYTGYNTHRTASTRRLRLPTNSSSSRRPTELLLFFQKFTPFPPLPSSSGMRSARCTRSRALHGPQCGVMSVPGVSLLRYADANAHPGSSKPS